MTSTGRSGVLRVLLVDPSSRGGIPAYTLLIARALRDAGACPEILGSKALEVPDAEFPFTGRLPVGRWGKPASAGPRFYLHRLKTWYVSAAVVLQHVRRSRPDVVHFQNPINRRFDARLVRRVARRVPVVWTAHDVLPFERTEGDSEWFASIYRTASRVVVHTEPAAAELRTLAGVDPVVIPHPVPDDVIDLPRSEARLRLGLASDGRLLAALGFIRAYKGYGLLADVWERLGEAAPTLLVMGELLADTEKPVLERLRATGRVDLRLGYASDHDLQLATRASDAVLLPYEVASDSGLVHLARALRVPVIASDAPQLAAAVRSAGAGVIVQRTVEHWSAAVTGELPAEPPAPPSLDSTAAAHLRVYRDLVGGRTHTTLRVAFYTDATEIGGAENALASLLGALNGDIEAVIVGTDSKVVDWLADRRPSARRQLVPPVRDKRDLRPILAQVRAIRRLQPDVLHANLRHPWSCQYGILAGVLSGTKVIAVEHAPIAASAGLQRRLKKFTSRRLAAHITVSTQAARAIEKLIGLRDGEIRTIKNGIDSPAPDPPERLLKAPVVGMVGRLSEEKGHETLLQALVDLPDVSAVIVGDGPERPRIERRIRDLGLVDRIRLTGWRDDARALIGTFDVLAVPSRFEAFGLSALEAMSAGVPVVASAVGGLPEVVFDGETGLLVPPADVPALRSALARLLADAELRHKLGERGREIAADRFGLQGMARRFECLYEEVTC